MNREVHVRFWESAGLQCLALLAYLRAYGTVSEARTSIGRYLQFYNSGRPHVAAASLSDRHRGAGPAKKAPRRLWTCRFACRKAWTTRERCSHAHSRSRRHSPELHDRIWKDSERFGV